MFLKAINVAAVSTAFVLGMGVSSLSVRANRASSSDSSKISCAAKGRI